MSTTSFTSLASVPGASLAIVLAACLSCFAAGAHGAGYDEAASGDLSNDRLVPTPLAGSPGANVVKGSFGNGDLDYVTLTVPAGQQLSAIILGNGTVFGGTRAFMGVQAGSTMTVDPNAGSAAGLLGWAHFDVGQYGRDILPEVAIGPGATGFSPPLGPGVYTFWIQETGLAPGLGFELDFRLSAVAASAGKQVPTLPVAAAVVMVLVLANIGARSVRSNTGRRDGERHRVR